MRVVVGVTGGVAAYKAAELVRRLQQEGLEVEVVMTRHAQEFITPLTFAALTGRKVITDMFSAEDSAAANVESAIEHIAVAQRADALVIAPATSNTIAKLAQGIADDFLSTLYLATTAPTIIAPAMNVNMWEHEATQANLKILRSRGVHIVAPDEGYLACGMVGAGRLAGVDAIAHAVLGVLGISRDLAAETILITAGPTCEDIDPVRYLTNRSSGKMGYALAEAAHRRGAKVILISGPVSIPAPSGVEFVSVRTAEEMRSAVRERVAESTVAIMAAAVADFRPAAQESTKIKRGSNGFTLEFNPLKIFSRKLPRRIHPRMAANASSSVSPPKQIICSNTRVKSSQRRARILLSRTMSRSPARVSMSIQISSRFFSATRVKIIHLVKNNCPK